MAIIQFICIDWLFLIPYSYGYVISQEQIQNFLSGQEHELLSVWASHPLVPIKT